MTRLRRLNARGVDAFRTFLQHIREGAEFQSNPAILHVDEFSVALPIAIDIEQRRFATKYDAATYLAELLRPLHTPTLTSEVELWSWLALFYFDQLSPRDSDGRRRPREDYHYIPDTGGWRNDRHLLAGPYKLLMQHGTNARLLLYPAVHEHGAFVYDLGSRRDLITNRGLIEAIDILYWDAKRQRPKRGATTTSRPGNLRRLIAVLQQLDLNYDLYGMTAGEILALLPPEFDAWRPAATAARLTATRATARDANRDLAQEVH